MRDEDVTILVVEDEPMVRMTLEDVLEDLPYRVTFVATGDAALQVLDDGMLPHVLLTDVRMPGTVDGLGLAREALRRGLPVIVFSGHIEDIDHKDALAGVQLLRKPFRISELLQALENAVPAVARTS